MENKAPLNSEIKSYRVVLIDSDGKRRGEFLRDDAIAMAREEGLDLVMVSSDNPPICKIMDYGKFLYQQKKGRTRTPTTKMKEIKLTPVTDTHDLNVRLTRARDFLSKGHKVKVTVVMRGRHRRFQDQAHDKAREFYEALEDVSQIDGKPVSSGRYLTMILSRKRTGA